MAKQGENRGGYAADAAEWKIGFGPLEGVSPATVEMMAELLARLGGSEQHGNLTLTEIVRLFEGTSERRGSLLERLQAVMRDNPGRISELAAKLAELDPDMAPYEILKHLKEQP